MPDIFRLSGDIGVLVRLTLLAVIAIAQQALLGTVVLAFDGPIGVHHRKIVAAACDGSAIR